MNCLHICNDLLGSKVHENLYKSLKELEINQVIYHPLRKHSVDSINKLNPDSIGEVITSKVLHPLHRVFFTRKINFLYEDLQSKVDVKSFDIVHATTLFSDGALALKIFKEYKIPYIIAVRGTDINVFLKYRFDLLPLGKEILLNAKHVIFISDSLKNNFVRSGFKLSKPFITKKQIIIPNGLDSYWLNNVVTNRKKAKPKKFLYIGNFSYNKNVLRLVKAFLILSEKYENLTLNLVGKGGAEEEKIKDLALNNPEKIHFHGPIYDKIELQKIYLSNDIFAMVSIGETFGLVYVEALTQGLPILYTENQGIDGTFKEKVGVSANPKSINSIMVGMETLINNYPQFETETIDFSKFLWNDIAKTYLKLYSSILNERMY